MKTNNEGKIITTITVALLVVGNGATLLTQRKKFPPKEKVLYFPKNFFIVTQKYPIFKTEKVSCIYLKTNSKFSKWKKIHVLVCWKTNFLYLCERVIFIHSFIYLFSKGIHFRCLLYMALRIFMLARLDRVFNKLIRLFVCAGIYT